MAVYNNPALGQAFSNLAQVFAPPSGGDLAGYASAAATKQKTSQLAQLFNLGQSPDFDQSVFDRLNIATGNYAPTQGYQALDMTDATNRRGQDITAATSITNNQADNAGALARLYATPTVLGQGETAFLPQQTQAATGLPALFSGAVSASPGEQITLPGGQVIAGAPKPMSNEEVKGMILQGLPAADQRNVAMSGIDIETIMGANGPTVVARPDAIGQTPYAAPTGAIETMSWRDPSGKNGSAFFDPTTKQWIDTQTKVPIPADATTYNATLQGGATETGLGPTTANQTAGNNQNSKVTSALNILDLYESTIKNNPGSVGAVGMIRGTAQDIVQTIKDMTAAFSNGDPQFEQTAQQVEQQLSAVAPELFDPAIPAANFLAGTLAYAIASTDNPGGEVSRQAYERAMDRISGGAFANTQSIQSYIDTYRSVLKAQLEGTEVLTDPTKARTDTSYQDPNAPQPGTVEDGYVFNGGDPKDPASWSP